MYQKPPPIITADSLRELSAKVEFARRHGQLPKGKVERYMDNRVHGYYQVMEWAQTAMFDAYSA